MPNPLRRTRHLRREIDAQALQLEADLEQVKTAQAQLRHRVVHAATSPAALLGSAGIGFLLGKAVGRPWHPKRRAQRVVTGLGALTLSAARSIGLQVALPLAIEWVLARFAPNAAASDQHAPPKSPPAPATRPRNP